MEHSQVATRLLCFSLIAAIEAGVRRSAREAAEVAARAEVLPSDVRDRAAKRWIEDRRGLNAASPDNDFALLDYTDFADLAKILYLLASDLERIFGFNAKPLASRLEQLAPIRNRVCHSRPLEPDDFASLYDFGVDIARNPSPPFEWNDLFDALRMIQENPKSVLRLIIPEFWSAEVLAPLHNLPLPEFDDTGFLGRLKDRKEVNNLLLAPHPVVSIVGEGGVGKTALALRCLYDLLEKPESLAYDAIIFVSLKTKTLTPAGSRQIEGAITSILGLARAVSSEFGDLAADDRDLNSLLEDIGEYLTEYRILLAIDNLETLSPDTVRPLLTRVGVGSKVVITSRMRLGEIELPYALTPLDSATSIALARSHAKTLNLQSIFSAKDQVLKQFCQRLYFNPLLIKWFVSSVAGGADPKNLVSHESASFQSAVTYCFENLFNRLTELERHLCQILAAARRPLLQVELYYLTQHLEREDFDVEWALRTLHQSSMLRREFTKGGDSTSIEYAVSEIAGEYISRKAPPSAQLFDMVQRQLKKLRQTVEAQSVELNSYKYSIFTVHANSREEKIAGVYLSRALQALRGRKYDEACEALSQKRKGSCRETPKHTG
jgi:LuxR family transcriptional regulator, glucitol operon activator